MITEKEKSSVDPYVHKILIHDRADMVQYGKSQNVLNMGDWEKQKCPIKHFLFHVSWTVISIILKCEQ